MKKVIGAITTYNGREHRYMDGYEVRIVAVLKDALTSGLDYDVLKHDTEIRRAGGVTSNDRIDVQPWIEKKGRFSFVTSDPKAIDLANFDQISG